MESIIILRMHIISNALKYLETSIVTDTVIQINLKRMLYCYLLMYSMKYRKIFREENDIINLASIN